MIGFGLAARTGLGAGAATAGDVPKKADRKLFFLGSIRASPA